MTYCEGCPSAALKIKIACRAQGVRLRCYFSFALLKYKFPGEVIRVKPQDFPFAAWHPLASSALPKSEIGYIKKM